MERVHEDIRVVIMEILRHEISCNRVEYIIKLLGLQRCADTVVGNQLLRGVSGGEKKRVTTAEILVGNAVVLLMDEISTGGVPLRIFLILFSWRCLERIKFSYTGIQYK